MERLVTERPAPAAAVNEVAEDPAFHWDALRSPLDTTFPLPSVGVVQRVAAGLYAKLQSGAITGRDQHEARFVLDILADWPDLDDELRTRVFQRLNLYAIVAAHGWPTAIAASAASTSNLVCVLPPGVTPIQQQRQQQPQRQGRGGRGQANQRAAAPAAPAPAPRIQHQRRPPVDDDNADVDRWSSFLNYNLNLILKKLNLAPSPSVELGPSWP